MRVWFSWSWVEAVAMSVTSEGSAFAVAIVQCRQSTGHLPCSRPSGGGPTYPLIHHPLPPPSCTTSDPGLPHIILLSIHSTIAGNFHDCPHHEAHPHPLLDRVSCGFFMILAAPRICTTKRWMAIPPKPNLQPVCFSWRLPHSLGHH